MIRVLPLLALTLLPSALQAQERAPRLDPAQKEALKARVAAIREQVSELRAEVRALRGTNEPGAQEGRERLRARFRAAGPLARRRMVLRAMRFHALERGAQGEPENGARHGRRPRRR